VAYATPADVAARLGRPLTPEETPLIQTRLNDVELIIRSRIPDLDQKIADGKLDREIVIMIECEAVLRLIRNPEGFMSETDGNYSYQISQSVASGRLDILPDEWGLLGVNPGAFTLRPRLDPLYPEVWWARDDWPGTWWGWHS
jgi:hypothetical protein